MGELNELFDKVVQDLTADGNTYTLKYLPECKGVALIRVNGKVLQGLELKILSRILLDTDFYSPDRLEQLQTKVSQKPQLPKGRRV